jgi:hypothetical protein
MDNISAVKNHSDIFKKKQALIRIEGFATLKKAGFNKEVPIKYEGIQDIERLRAIVATNFIYSKILLTCVHNAGYFLLECNDFSLLKVKNGNLLSKCTLKFLDDFFNS